MHVRRFPRLTGAVARRLLDGGGGPSPLPELLAAAQAPATAAELQGEPAARAAFRSSLHTCPLPPDIPRRSPVKTTTTIMVAKAIAAIALTASTAGGVALATHSSPTAPKQQLHSTTEKAATQDGLAFKANPLTTSPPDAIADGHPRPDTPVGPAQDGEDSKAINDRAALGASHPTGRCRALSNISNAGQSGKAADSAAFADLSCADNANATANAKPTGRPTAAPGNPEHRTGKPDTDRATTARGDTAGNKQADKTDNRDQAGRSVTAEGRNRSTGDGAHNSHAG
jgi:hypothetical protein